MELRASWAACVAVVMGIGAPACRAQWQASSLHPLGQPDSSRATVASGGYQAGEVTFGGVDEVTYASLWAGTGASWTSIHPAGAVQSGITGGVPQLQVGWVRTPSLGLGGAGPLAGLWSGTASSFIPLHPSGAHRSQADATDGTSQVGWATVGPPLGPVFQHASLWSGTAASWLDLHPAGAEESAARGVGGGMQVGWTSSGGMRRAAIWSGTALSHADLNPVGASESVAMATDGLTHVGSATVGGLRVASMWSGGPASWVNLNPAGATDSEAVGISGAWQVGTAVVNGEARASLWMGSAASWIDLGAFVPSGFGESHGLSVWSDGSTVHVAGDALNTSTQGYEAMLWTIPSPGAGAVLGLAALRLGRRRR